MKLSRLAFACLAVQVGCAESSTGPKPVAPQSVTLGGRSVVVWEPSGSASTRQPVIIFSHGLGGCARQSEFLTEALAASGYWVFAPNHRDAGCADGSALRPPARVEESFLTPDKWSDATYADRRDDIVAVLAAIPAQSDYSNRVDLTKVGLVGHSLGGYTVVGLGGAWASWKLPNIKAVLALSPYVDPYIAHATLKGLSAPVMYQGGTLDFGITPSLARQGGAYDSSPTPKYFVELAGAGHFAWTNLERDASERILNYSLAFLDHYIRGAVTPALTTTVEGVSTLRFASELGSR